MFDWFWNFLYGIQKSICIIIDFIVSTFRVLAGLNPIMIDGEKNDILTYFLNSQTIRQAFFLVVMISVVLLFIFCIAQTIRKQYLKSEQRSYGAIIGQALKSGLMFLLVPLVFIVANALLTVIVQQLDLATNPYYQEIIDSGASGYSGMSFGGQLLVTLGHDSYIGDAASRASIEAQFINGELNYTVTDTVRQYYDLNTMDYFLGYVAGIAILILFAISLLQFVERVFNILLLFIVAPISVSSSVLDDGVRFKLWRDQVVGKFLCAYSIIISINLFFIIIPLVNEIDFGIDIPFVGRNFGNYLIKMFFILGGAYAVHKSVAVIGNLIQQGLGSQELQDRKNAMFLAGGAMHAMTGAARSVGRHAAHTGKSAFNHTAGRGIADRKQQHDFARMTRNQEKATERMNRRSGGGDANNRAARYDGGQADNVRTSILADNPSPLGGGNDAGGGGNDMGGSRFDAQGGGGSPADDSMRNRVHDVVSGSLGGKKENNDKKGGK